jgi:hypothetical protein
VRAPLCLGKGIEQKAELLLSADERRVGLGARRHGAESHEPIGRDGFGLTLERKSLGRLNLHGAAHEPVRELAEEDLAGVGGLL